MTKTRWWILFKISYTHSSLPKSPALPVILYSNPLSQRPCRHLTLWPQICGIFDSFDSQCFLTSLHVFFFQDLFTNLCKHLCEWFLNPVYLNTLFFLIFKISLADQLTFNKNESNILFLLPTAMLYFVWNPFNSFLVSLGSPFLTLICS